MARLTKRQLQKLKKNPRLLRLVNGIAGAKAIRKINQRVKSIKDGENGLDGITPTDAELIELIRPLIPEVSDGHTPTNEELRALIKPLIPKVKDGKSPTKAQLLKLIQPLIPKVRDGHTPTKKELLDLIKPLIPNVEDGHTPTRGELLSLIEPLIPPVEHVSPDTPEQIKGKLKELPIKEPWFNVGHVSGLENKLKRASKGVSRGGGADEFTDLKDTPASYSGESGKVVTVKSTEDGLEFVTNVTTDEKVSVSSNDTTPDYLVNKLTATAPITVTETGDGGDEDLDIDLDINAQAEKTTLADDDIFRIEDSADSNNPKKVKKSSLSSGIFTLISDTTANILATANKGNQIGVSTDTPSDSSQKHVFVDDGTDWLRLELPATIDAAAPDMGLTDESGKQGYHPDYITDKTLHNIRILGSVLTDNGSLRLDTTQDPPVLELYKVNVDAETEGFEDILTDINFALENELTHKPLSERIDVWSGNSNLVGLNGRPIITQYQVSMGAYPPPLVIDGGLI